jgi:hypothetical protein
MIKSPQVLQTGSGTWNKGTSNIKDHGKKKENKIVGSIAYLSSWGNNIHIFAGHLLRSTLFSSFTILPVD